MSRRGHNYDPESPQAGDAPRLPLSIGRAVDNQDQSTPNSTRFVTPSSLWPPRLISDLSAWNQHVPFAGWVVEATRPKVFVELGTHIGVSYFAFCESVARLEVGTRCFAVDTWLGDEHAGFYGEGVYRSVQKVNSRYYEAFSRLIRTTFDDAAEEFDDASIDLLHLDGLHTYEAVRHDFETWLPKLSERAVMLFHDTNERKKGFGVHRFLAELRKQYPTFEFTHGHGLGVVCVGKDVPQAIAQLVALEDDPPRLAELRGVYEALGRRLSSEHQESLLTTTVAKRDATLAEREAKLAEFVETVAKRDAKLAAFVETVAKRDAKLAKFSATIIKRDTELAGLYTTVAKRDVMLAELSGLIAERDSGLAESSALVAKRDQQLATSRRKTAEIRRSLSRLRGRRTVRLALALSRPFRPLFRIIRRLKKGRGSSNASSGQERTAIVASQATATKPTSADLSSVPTPNLLPLAGSHSGRVTVIVPVFNAPDELSGCLRALMRNTTGDTTLLIIDDASTDDRIAPILDEYARIEGIRVLKNEQNLGFVKTVNRGFAESSGDVVLLNSDVEVTPGWLDRLRLAVSVVPDAGTVTPLSDNAGAFSAPEVGKHNALPPALTRDEIGRLVAQSAQRSYPRGPTGNGYCMYVRRACLDDVGMFDAEAFPRGYGEENDFCMRAMEKGWTNVVDDSTYVFHSRSASFGDEKHELMDAGRKVLDQRYPEYGPLVRQFISSPEFISARQQIGGVFQKASNRRPRPRPRVLFVLHSAGGGTPATTQDLIQGLDRSYESFVLVSNGSVVTLTRYDNTKAHEVGRWSLRQRISVTDSTCPEYRNIVQSVLIDHGIDVVHIRHLIGHTFELPGIARSLDIPVVLSFHDFYYICPTVHLMDDMDHFCGGVCSAGQGTCPTPTPWLAGLPHLKHSWVYDWRQRASEMFKNVALFITASESTRDFYVNAFPELEERRFEVIEHGRDLVISSSPAGKEPTPGGPIRILLPGNIGLHKGSRFVRQLAEIDKDRRLEFHLLGRAGGDLEGIVTRHGTYDRSEFETRARIIGPTFVGLFSTTAESFSHVLTEAWAAGIPVLASRLGALEDRVERHGGGWLLDVDDPVGAYQRILEVAADPDTYRVQQELATEAATGSRSLNDMAIDYAEVYGRLTQERRSFASDDDPSITGNRVLRVGVFVPGGAITKDVKPPGHIRIVRRLLDPGMVDRVVWKLLDVEAFLEDDSDEPDIDVAVVHRTAIPSSIVDIFVEKCQSEGIGIVFDIDDDLLSDDPGWSELEFYEPFRYSIETLIAAAGTVTVSTSMLADRLAGLSNNIAVLNNALDRSLWFLSLASYSRPPDAHAAIEKAAGPRLLFAGGMTHQGDLEILRSALRIVREKMGLAVDLYVVGGVPPSDRADWYKVIGVPSGHGYYPRFVQWLRSMDGSFDIGVAPLADTRVNSSKSDLRFLEYSALGLPGVYSRAPAFSSVDDEETGLLVDNTAEAWAEAIVRLWKDKGLRDRVRKNALDYVIEERLISGQRDEYLTHLLSASRLGSSVKA